MRCQSNSFIKIHAPHLSPGDGWYIRVSRSSTGDYQLSPSLLTVLPPGPYVKVRGVLRNHHTVMDTKSTAERAENRPDISSGVPLAPKWQGETCPWYLGRCKAHRCRCPGSPLQPRPPGYFHLASGSTQGTRRQEDEILKAVSFFDPETSHLNVFLTSQEYKILY